MRVIWHGGPWDGQRVDLPDDAREALVPDPSYTGLPVPLTDDDPPRIAPAVPVIRVPLCRYVNSQGGVEPRLNWAGRTPR